MNMNPVINKMKYTLIRHQLPQPGAYARWLWQSSRGDRKMGTNEYGCADAANLRYILGIPVHSAEEQQACVKALQQFQNPDTGVFYEGSHHLLHCTAHCIAALELFDALPAVPLKGLAEYTTSEGVVSLLEHLDWGNPWPQAHQGAGIFAALILTGNASSDWQDAYFSWLDAHTDPRYGMSLAGSVEANTAPVCHHLFGWFHYLFNYSFVRRPFPQAHALIDTCIDLYRRDQLGEGFGHNVGFREIDWVYALNRGISQTGYRFAEGKSLLRSFAKEYVHNLEQVDADTDESWNDLHSLFGGACALAELQMALPGELTSDFPLRLVLDRRPFI